MSQSRKPRQSNFEILRIISILLIIAFHYVYKAGWDVSAAPLANKLVIDSFGMGGEIGVNLFVLISGYFLISGRFSWKKLVLLLVEVMFYNYLSLLVLAKGDLASFFSSITIADVFPTVFCAYWFTTAYAMLYLFSPYLSRGLKALDGSEYLRLIVIALVVWCVIPTVTGLFEPANNTEVFLFYSRFVWMTVLFMIGGFISLFGDQVEWLGWAGRRYALLAAGAFAVLLAFMACVECHPNFAAKIGIHSAWYFWPPNTVFELFISWSIFMAFRSWKAPSLPTVNKIATATLGIYLLHDGKLQTWLWTDVFHNAAHVDSPLLVLYILASVMLVFAAGTVIDLVRQMAEKGILTMVDKVHDKLPF